MDNIRSVLKRIFIAIIISASVGTVFIAPEVTYAKKSTKKTSVKTPPKTQHQRSSADIKSEKKKNEREIAETRKKLADNEEKTRSHLDNLNSINSQIERQEATIGDLQNHIETLESQSIVLRDSIREIERRDSILLIAVAQSLRKKHVYKKQLSPLTFILSASSFAESQRRLNYIEQLERAHKNQIAELRQTRRRLNLTRASLDSLSVQHTEAITELAGANSVLDSRRRQSAQAVEDLKKESASLNKILAEKKKKVQQLDNELNRIIAAEERRQREEAERKKRQEQQKKQPPKTKPSPGRTVTQQPPRKDTKPAQSQSAPDPDRTLSGSFASNKGHLLFPVAGKYTIVGTFGRSQHNDLSHVQVDNSGIDIMVSPGTAARAVFDGTVSSIFFMDGFENIVIVRHGEYLTVYAGLSGINVSKGSSVKAGTRLGTIATIDGRTVLHFEVRKERTKLNPLQWVR